MRNIKSNSKETYRIKIKSVRKLKAEVYFEASQHFIIILVLAIAIATANTLFGVKYL